MLNSFAPQERADMVENGKVVVTCEFCSSVYEFSPAEAGVGAEGAADAGPDAPA
jgi:molecular chaperone Hsp33